MPARPLPSPTVQRLTTVFIAVPANCDACRQEAQIVRASLAPYNTKEDMDALASALKRIQVGR